MLLILILFFLIGSSYCEEKITLECENKKLRADSCKITHVDGDFSNKKIVIDNGDTKLETIKIKGVHLGRIPISMIVDHKDVSVLELKDCSIFSLNGIENFKQLTELKMLKNRISEVGDGQLDNPKLTVLQLEFNDINTIHSNAFKKTPMLNQLLLSNNKLQTIEPEVFVNTLETIDLENNLLENVDGLFNNHLNLKRLNLAGNKIKIISAETFSGCDHLFKLKISNNLIETVDDKAFDTLTSLQVVDLHENHLKSLHIDINNGYMGGVDVSHNKLEELTITMSVPELKRKFRLKAEMNMLPAVSLPDTIKYNKIDLSDNPLTTLPSKSTLEHVEFLYLDNIDLSLKDLAPLASNEILTSISLNATNISHDTFKMLLEHQTVLLIDVSNNPQLHDFDFTKITMGAANLETLEMNNCNLNDVNTEVIKNLFPKLKNFEIHGNNFSRIKMSHIKSAVSHKSAPESFNF